MQPLSLTLDEIQKMVPPPGIENPVDLEPLEPLNKETLKLKIIGISDKGDVFFLTPSNLFLRKNDVEAHEILYKYQSLRYCIRQYFVYIEINDGLRIHLLDEKFVDVWGKLVDSQEFLVKLPSGPILIQYDQLLNQALLSKISSSHIKSN